MRKRSSKKGKMDLNKLAAEIVNQATSETLHETTFDNSKNPAAVALGRLGGLKGGKARAEKLTDKQRREIAKKAAEARWKKKSTSN
ncbi:MAG: hypothetical protein A2167_05715 [Planctomycetes bacterium RBG_13_46_10]|nr:MAG: hypothetical protein A2167_05715 [Planctomycetes bacterium RBG_13_46_10]